MGFFDLNIPYLESDRHVTDKSSLKSRRLKLALKAMEFGFTGVAYNRTLRGVMAESDRCSTTLFPLSKLAASSSSSFVAAVKFHRELLNVPVAAPFRQYTRLTVIVDTPAQASVLNTGNPILRSYDIVAVSPVNQNAFDQACQTSEVDMIAIDFSDKLPFRLKQPMVKAAIKRGVYFEITYSGLIGDAQSRRQVISNCKLLVDWTRGQNLIISSAAPSATELRGPQDVANLFSLLGLPMERAKAAITKNCRSLLGNALRKKHFYKEAIKVEKIPSGAEINLERTAFDDWLKWDPISSGEGDLLLDDLEKSFAVSNSVEGTTKKTIDFTSSLNGLPAHGLQIKDLLCAASNTSLGLPITDNSMSAAMEIEQTAAVENSVVQAGLNPLHENESSNSALSKKQVGHEDFKLSLDNVFDGNAAILQLPKEVQAPVNDANYGYKASGLEESTSSLPPNGTSISSKETLSISVKKAKFVMSGANSHGTPSSDYEGNILNGDEQVHASELIVPRIDNHASVELPNLLHKSIPSSVQLEQTNVDNREDGIYALEGVKAKNVSNKIDIENGKRIPLASPDTSSQDAYVVGEHCKMRNKSVKLGDGLSIGGSSNLKTDSKEPIFHGVSGDKNEMGSIPNHQSSDKFQAGRARRKQNSPDKPFLFPFKRLGPRLSKKKSRKLKSH